MKKRDEGKQVKMDKNTHVSCPLCSHWSGKKGRRDKHMVNRHGMTYAEYEASLETAEQLAEPVTA